MTVTRYDEKNPFPSTHGFSGIRVAVSVDSVLHQKWFAFSKYDAVTTREIRELEERARAREAEWKALSEAKAAKKALQARPTARSTTGSAVRGIYASRYSKRLRSGRQRTYPVWAVNAAETTPRKFHVQTKGDYEAFVAAVEFLCAIKGWADEVAAELKSRWIRHPDLTE